MTYLQRLWRSELVALCVLVACAGIVAIYGFVDGIRMGLTTSMSPGDAAAAGFVYTLVFGALPALLYGAPLYALLWHAGSAAWSTAILIGVLPGLLGLALLRGDAWLGYWALGCGVIVAIATHALIRRWLWRSNSAPHRDGREASHVGRPSSAPARGRER
jgi:hypothetical protein